MSRGRKPMKYGTFHSVSPPIANLLYALNRSTSIAMMTIAGVIGGTWVIFRLMAPKRGTVVTTSEEIDAFRGSGNQTARPPRKGYSVPRGGSI